MKLTQRMVIRPKIVFCHDCGHAVGDTERVCPTCGSKMPWSWMTETETGIQQMKTWTLEIFCDGYHQSPRQIDVEIEGNPVEGKSNIEDVVRDALRSLGTHFHPIEDDPNYAGWSRLVINIGPQEVEE